MLTKIHGFSTALFSTWILAEDHGILFDAGDGASGGLLQKARKAKTIAISHADRDHLTGLLQLNQLNAGHSIERLLYPADSGSFPALRDFCGRFDPETAGTYPWIGVRPGDRIEVGNGLKLEVVTNTHIDTDLVKSVGYRVIRTKKKLKAEFAGLAPAEIESLNREFGQGHVTEQIESVELAYAGDTGVEDAAKWTGCETLIHEATFVDPKDAESTRSRNQHSSLREVMEMAVQAGPGRLILHHFSTRYSSNQIVEAVRSLGQELAIDFPVFTILPGETGRDILNQPPTFEPQNP